MFFFFFLDKFNTRTCDSLVSYLNIISELPLKMSSYDKSSNQIEINEIQEGIDLYRYFLNKENNKNDIRKVKYYYRGQYSKNYDLLPSVFRKPYFKKEDFYYHQIKVDCPQEFMGRGRLDQLVKMQHYDCPTRLLDITSNPLVALYFSCKKFNSSKMDEDNEGVVYIFAANEDDILFSDSDKALMLACLSRFKYEEQYLLYKECVKYLKHGKKIKHPIGTDLFKRFVHEVEIEKPSFKYNISPLDLLKCYYVQPEKTNDRILKQDGAFIISGLSSDTEEAKEKLESMSYLRIIIHNQNKILEELDKIGINEATLFPEIDKIADYLKNK